jgi:hypothetical protein
VDNFATLEAYSAGPSGLAVSGVVLNRLDAEIVRSNAAEGMDVCPHLSGVVCAEGLDMFRLGSIAPVGKMNLSGMSFMKKLVRWMSVSLPRGMGSLDTRPLRLGGGHFR